MMMDATELYILLLMDLDWHAVEIVGLRNVKLIFILSDQCSGERIQAR